MDEPAVRERVGRVEALLDEVEEGSAAEQAIAALVELYGEALRRLLDGADPLADELVRHLLVLHGLHPLELEERIQEALEEVRPYLRSHGGGVELLGVERGVARLRLEGSCDGCPSSASTLRLAVEEAVLRAAPELERVEAEGVAEPGPALVQLRSFRTTGAGEAGWSTVGAMPQLASGGTVVREVAGAPLLFTRVGGVAYAYRGPCPACSAALAGGRLDGAELVCPGCERRFDVLRAGRCLDAPALSLEPVPLLESDQGLLRVAVA